MRLFGSSEPDILPRKIAPESGSSRVWKSGLRGTALIQSQSFRSWPIIISRDWATPLTIGAFAIMSVTGVLMFFHLDTGLNKSVHEWAGWAMVTGVAAHVAVNWKAFKRYFISSRLGQVIISVGVLVLAASFTSLSRGGGGFPPPVLAMKAITGAPISSVAPLTGRPVPELIDALNKAGVSLPGPDATIDSVTGGSWELEAKAMTVLFHKT